MALTVDAPPPRPPEPPPDPHAALAAAELAAFEKAKPVFDKWCARCHVQGSKDATMKSLEYFDMTTYPYRGTTREIRVVLGLVEGAKATMPRHEKGAVKGDELAAIAAWADAFDASHH